MMESSDWEDKESPSPSQSQSQSAQSQSQSQPPSQPQQQQQRPTKHRPRQSPGAACEECRRRKLRCDRNSPQCGVCSASGVVCQFKHSRAERGTKKGNLQQLQQRMAALEERLLAATENGLLFSEPILDTYKAAMSPEIVKIMTPALSPEASGSTAASLIDLRLPPSPPLPSGTELPMILREELDQLYFDRVHTFAPMVHQGRYNCWTAQQSKSEPKEALQYAMWTLGACFSGQLQQLSQSLYHETRRMLDVLELKGTEIETIELEHLQACILLAIYEFMHSYDRRGWMRAGYAFRLVQLMRLFELDSPAATVGHSDWVEVEEKRRTFWVAFCLDRFLSIPNRCPLTLIEHLIVTRLPAPEAAFQSGQPVVMDFLADAIATTGPMMNSPFTELVMVATVCGRALIHHYQALVENSYTSAIRNFHDRHEWIHSTLVQRLESLSMQTPAVGENSDSLMLFTRMLAQTTVLYLYHTLELSACDLESLEIAAALEYDEIALMAAQEMVSLTRMLSQINSFKIHPLTPIPLTLCADFLVAYRDPTTRFYTKLQEVFQALQNVKCVNSLGHKFIQVLEISKGQQMVMSITNAVS